MRLCSPHKLRHQVPLVRLREGTTDEKQGAQVGFRSDFASISAIGSVTDARRRAADRLLWLRFGLDGESTGARRRVSGTRLRAGAPACCGDGRCVGSFALGASD
jgi:hypothetical protein